MEQKTSLTKTSDFLRRNWFKIILISFVVFLFFKKDLSFQINLRSPLKKDLPTEEQPIAPVKEKKEARPEAFTDNLLKDATVEGSIVTSPDKFELPFFGSSGAKEPSPLDRIDQNIIHGYLKRFAHVAVSEQKKYGIPASITLANGLLHSRAGTREMAILGNNHFAIPCTSRWDGEMGEYIGRCYRHYRNAWSGFRDHSEFITYHAIKNADDLVGDGYEKWAYAMEKSDYSEESNLAEQLIHIIEKYGLSQLDE